MLTLSYLATISALSLAASNNIDCCSALRSTAPDDAKVKKFIA